MMKKYNPLNPTPFSGGAPHSYLLLKPLTVFMPAIREILRKKAIFVLRYQTLNTVINKQKTIYQWEEY